MPTEKKSAVILDDYIQTEQRHLYCAAPFLFVRRLSLFSIQWDRRKNLFMAFVLKCEPSAFEMSRHLGHVPPYRHLPQPVLALPPVAQKTL